MLRLAVLLLALAAVVLAEAVNCTTVEWSDQSPVQVGNYIMQINMWNMAENASGWASLSYCGGAFNYSQDLVNIAIKDPSHYVIGYPEVWVGRKPWFSFSTPGSPLPMKASELMGSAVFVYMKYSLDVSDPGLPLDFSIDVWETRGRDQQGVYQGDAEFMVWFYYQNLRPAGDVVGEVSIPLYLNGQWVDATFLVYKYPSMPWEYIAFVMDPPMRSAEVLFNLADFVEAAARYSSLPYYGDLWVDDVEVGSEFGSPSTTQASFGWTLKFDVFAPGGATAAQTVTVTATQTATSYATVTTTATVTKTAIVTATQTVTSYATVTNTEALTSTATRWLTTTVTQRLTETATVNKTVVYTTTAATAAGAGLGGLAVALVLFLLLLLIVWALVRD